MGFTRVIDSTADPELELLFSIAPDALSVWVRVHHVKQKPDVWAKQRLAPPRDQPDGAWRRVGTRAEWQDFAGNKVSVPAKLMERPRLDPQLKRIEPMLARLRYSLDHSDASSPGQRAVYELLTAIDHFEFRARTSRGPSSTTGRPDDQVLYRDRRRKGLAPASARFTEDPEFVCVRPSAQPDSDIFLILH